MKKTLFIALALLCLFLPAEAKKKVRVHTIGDSTMADYDENTTPKRGWGMMFQQFFTGDLTVNNRAKSGASSKSFYEESAYWESVKKQIKPGDYVLIQFAHNDEKTDGMDGDELIAYYKSVGDEAGAAATDYRGTTAAGTYKDYLRKYIEETRALGATPVLVSPICRNYFTGSTIRRNGMHDLGDDFSVLTADGIKTGQSVPADDHSQDYPYQMKQVADEMGVSFIDITTATKQLYEGYGSAQCKALLFTPDDNTHTSAMGATLVARLAAQLLQEQGILAGYINLTSELSVNPSACNLGQAYAGMTVTKEMQVSGFDLQPESGTVTVTASDGIQVSADGNDYSSSLTLQYEGGTMIGSFWVKCEFAREGAINETVTVTSGDKTITVPVTGTVATLAEGAETQAYWRLESNDECILIFLGHLPAHTAYIVVVGGIVAGVFVHATILVATHLLEPLEAAVIQIQPLRRCQELHFENQCLVVTSCIGRLCCCHLPFLVGSLDLCRLGIGVFALPLFFILKERIVDGAAQTAHSLVSVQVFLFGRGGDEAQFYQHAGHRACFQHEETCLVDPTVIAPAVIFELTLDHGSKVDALLHVLILHQFKYYI